MISRIRVFVQYGYYSNALAACSYSNRQQASSGATPVAIVIRVTGTQLASCEGDIEDKVM